MTTLVVAGFLCVPAVAVAGMPNGFRIDGTGRLDVPLASLSVGEGAWRWSRPVGLTGLASPVAFGEVVVVTVEPFTLVALDVNDGHEAWRAVLDPIDAAEPADRAALYARREAAGLARVELRAALERLARARRARRVRDAPPVTRVALEAAVKEVGELVARSEAAAELELTHAADSIGTMAPTPVTDGETLFALGRNGVVAALDRDGRRRWTRAFPREERTMNGHGGGHAASPVLAGGRLLVPYGDLVALDPSSGAEAWRVPEYRDFGTPSPVQVDGAWFVALPDGRVVEAGTGRVTLVLPAATYYVGPVVDGPRLYYAGGREWFAGTMERPLGVHAFELVRDGGVQRATVLWRTALAPDRCYSAAVTDGVRLYVTSDSGDVRALDLATGKVLASARIVVGSVQAPLLLARDALVVLGHSGSLVRLDPDSLSTLGTDPQGEGAALGGGAGRFFVVDRERVRAFQPE